MKTLEILLLDNIPNLGIVGDVVKVKPGYARNYLLPRGLADRPTPGAIAKLAERRKEVEAEMKKIRSAQETLIDRLEDYELTMPLSANEQGILYGGVSQHDIAEALQAEGYQVEDRFVRLGDQIKRLDSYTVPIVIDKDLKTEIKVWIVSDKPLENLEAEGETDEQTQVEEAEEVADNA